jgi:SsrA-binding protein
MKIYNRKFRREYQEIEKYEAGIALSGAEVKSIRAGRIRLEEAFVKIMSSGVYLINAEIPIYQYTRPQGYDSRRSRKLLLHKQELVRLKTKLNSGRGLTIVPVSCYNKGSLIKLEIALAKGIGDIGRKKLEKKRDLKREEEKEMKEYIKS